MPITDRHAPVDPECPHGGPPLSDSMMEWAYGRLEWFEKTALKRTADKGGNAVFTVSLLGIASENSDFTYKGLGAIRAYVGAMIHYIKEIEKEFDKSPFPGIDPARLCGATIKEITPDVITFSDGRMIRRNGMNWEWLVDLPDPE